MDMIVYINHKAISIFKGAIVLDAIRAYSAYSLKQVMNGKLFIMDKFGNITDPDGPLLEGQKLSLKRKQPML